MGINKRLINTGGAAPAPLDPLANFETVTYTGNGGTQAINGYIRKGAAFNGSSSVISIPLNVVSVSSAYTVSLWFNAVNVGINTGIFTNQGSSAISGQIGINIISSTQINLYSIVNNGSNTVDAIAATVPTMSANDWNHLVVIGDRSLSNKVKLYLNGTEASNYSFNAGVGSNTLYSTAQIGRSDGRFMNGKLDQIRLFNSSITQTNINTLKDETYASATKSTTDIFGNGSGVALYELEDNSNDTGIAIDSGQSGVFNGTNSDIAISGSIASSTMSLSIWVFIDSTITTNQIVFEFTNGYALYFLSNAAGKLGMQSSNANSQHTLSGAQLGAGGWHHVVCVWNSGSRTFYIDKVVQNGGSVTDFLTADQNTIGSRGSNFFNGKLDQARVYSSALSAADVTNIYNETNIPTSNFVSWYKLDGNANDSKGSNNGTWSGSEAYSTPAKRQHNGTDTAINYLGMAFKPDLICIKERGGNDRHILIDSIRLKNSQISSNSTAAETTYSSNLTSFDSNGFTLGSASESNGTNDTYVAWCWRAAASNATNNDGTIQSTVRANVEAGFSIVKWTTSSQLDTVGHGLESSPELIIGKGINWASSWPVYALPVGNDKKMSLNDNIAAHTSTIWGDTTPTDTTFKQDFTGTANRTSIAYCFHSVAGYQKVGSYSGGGASNVTVSLGFEPRWIMVKGIANGYNWVIWDQVRKAGTVPYDNDFVLFTNTDVAEKTNSTARGIQFTSTGFVLNQNNILSNDSGVTYIFLAIA